MVTLSVAEPKSNPAIQLIRLIRQEISERLQRGQLRYQGDRKTLVHHLALAQEVGDMLLVGQLQEILGAVDNEVGNFDSAETHWQSAYRVFESINNWSGMSIVQNNLGELYLYLNRRGEAQAAFYLARELAERADNLQCIMRIESNLGFLWLRQGYIRKAKICFSLVVVTTENETWQHIYSLVMARRGLAEVYLIEQNFDEAWREANEAEHLASGRGLKQVVGLTQLTKAHIAQLDPKTPGAEGYYFQLGWDILRECVNLIVLGRTYLSEAYYQQQMGNSDRVKEYALEAHQIFLQLDLKDETALAEEFLREEIPYSVFVMPL